MPILKSNPYEVSVDGRQTRRDQMKVMLQEFEQIFVENKEWWHGRLLSFCDQVHRMFDDFDRDLARNLQIDVSSFRNLFHDVALTFMEDEVREGETLYPKDIIDRAKNWQEKTYAKLKKMNDQMPKNDGPKGGRFRPYPKP